MLIHRVRSGRTLLKEINSKRDEMILQAILTGFTSQETLKISQELDELINIFQRCKQNNTPKKTDIKQTFFFFSGGIQKLKNT